MICVKTVKANCKQKTKRSFVGLNKKPAKLLREALLGMTLYLQSS